MSRSNIVKLTKSSQIPEIFPKTPAFRDFLPLLFSVQSLPFSWQKEKRPSVKLKANTDGRRGL